MARWSLVLIVAVFTLKDSVSSFLLPCKNAYYRCGYPAVQPVSTRIIGGQEATEQSWPWIVQLWHDNRFVCGGAIINESFVLTAAHCFAQRTNTTWKVFAGKHRIDRNSVTQQTPKIGEIIPHKDFSLKTFENDIALIYLEEPFTFDKTVRPICLPMAGKSVTTGEMCLVAGWGDTRGTGIESILNQVEIPIISDEVCSEPGWYGTGFHGETTFCAGYEQGGKDTCKGDSGGPLICKDGETWAVQGIASWGIECGVYRWPGIYTQVSNFTDWIERHMESHPLSCP